MKLLKHIAISVACILILYTDSAHAYALYHKCEFKYAVNSNFTVCSERSLKDIELRSIGSKYDKAKKFYNILIKKYKYVLSNTNIPLTIYLMPLSILNDTNTFSKPAGQILYGKYIDWEGLLYSHYDAALMVNNTDLIHELGHYFNNNVVITNNKVNENIAQELEQYYIAHL